MAEVRKEYFQYIIDFESVSANERRQQALQISADADFIVVEVSRTRTGSFKIRVLDTGSGLEWTNDFVDDDNFFGSAYDQGNRRPYRLPVPKRLKKNTTIAVTVWDTSGASNTIQVAFIGYKEYQS